MEIFQHIKYIKKVVECRRDFCESCIHNMRLMSSPIFLSILLIVPHWFSKTPLDYRLFSVITHIDIRRLYMILEEEELLP